ncbi:MAG TPA: hypothetical protein VIY48_06555, partial [Candidatus Paceibacterota bacterium]
MVKTIFSQLLTAGPIPCRLFEPEKVTINCTSRGRTGSFIQSFGFKPIEPLLQLIHARGVFGSAGIE